MGGVPEEFQVDYKPSFPADYSPGIGIIGCGGIVKNAHLPAYKKYGLRVVGVYDVLPQATEGVIETFGVERVYDSLEDLLADPAIEVVDIATHPAERFELINKALDAGKHVLSQKPLALTLSEAKQLVSKAEHKRLKLAVNQNGRWAPPWRVATILVQKGIIGDVLSVTHLYDINYSWVTGTNFDRIKHFAIYDYSIHWVDITRCWMEGKIPSVVRAREYRTPIQPSDSITPWGMWMDFEYPKGYSAFIRGVGCSQTSQEGHYFWIHGREGTIRGSVLGSDYVELEKDGNYYKYELEGQWFPDGFAGSMAELLSSVKEDREPYNSASHNLLSLQMVLAACKSAESSGNPVSLEEVEN